MSPMFSFNWLAQVKISRIVNKMCSQQPCNTLSTSWEQDLVQIFYKLCVSRCVVDDKKYQLLPKL